MLETTNRETESNEERLDECRESSGRLDTDDQYTHAALGFGEIMYAASVLAFHVVVGGVGKKEGWSLIRGPVSHLQLFGLQEKRD